ncbi:MAG TPA: DUF2849 domain-containing protein [Parvularculaceae bacterium]|nr:DUF2849 domain-containing protein [Parvularculaceae bacterium]HNS86825.1 DUF2849 domain-containing protein [Parvularculaceae bacterium]
MKAITANRLSDGAVLYVGDDESFVDRFEQARLFEPGEAEKVLAQVLNRKTAIASAYLIEAEATGPIGREALRETIRKNGPTVRRDLGKQAELINERL